MRDTLLYSSGIKYKYCLLGTTLWCS